MKENNSDPKILKVFRAWLEEGGLFKSLDEPIRGTNLYRPKTDSIPLPENTPEWVRVLVETMETDPKRFQIEILRIDLSARLERGSLLDNVNTADNWIDKAAGLDLDDPMRSWYLRQVATEYLIQATKGDEDAELRSKELILAVLGGDRVLTEDIYPMLIDIVQTSSSSNRLI